MAAAINMHMLILMSVVLTVNLIGIIFFCEKLFTILYGVPSKPAEDLEFFEILTKEKQILQLLLF